MPPKRDTRAPVSLTTVTPETLAATLAASAMSSQTLSLITIPLFTGAIGYVTNWTGVWMLFYPVRFAGFKVPGLAAFANLLPRRIRQIPGIGQGGIGWQGIIPSRAAKMGSIAVDKGIAKLGGAADFYEQLDAEAIAEHILTTARGDIHAVVERIMERDHPQLWHDLPPRLRAAVHARVEEQLPQLVRRVTEEIGAHADQLVDLPIGSSSRSAARSCASSSTSASSSASRSASRPRSSPNSSSASGGCCRSPAC